MNTLKAADSALILSLVTEFTRDLEGIIGGQLIGVVLFGSQARGEAGPDSDIDLAIIVSDSSAHDLISNLANLTLQQTALKDYPVALCFETYGRIKALVAAGDPFASVVLAEGVLLSDRNELLAHLRRVYAGCERALDSGELTSHLTHKANSHLDKALSAFNEALCQLQLAGMAVGQACILKDVKELTSADVQSCCQWKGLAERLRRSGMTADQVSFFDAMINGHKRLRLQSGAYPGREIVDSVSDLRAHLQHENAVVAT